MASAWLSACLRCGTRRPLAPQPLATSPPRRRCSHSASADDAAAAAPAQQQLVLEETPALLAAGLVLQHDFISEVEERELVELVDERLADTPYADAHYDSVISGYREFELPITDIVTPGAAAAVQRMRQCAWTATHGVRTHEPLP